jgi:tetratricopeptide (TPR) repeat protein
VFATVFADVSGSVWPFLHRPRVDPELRGEELSKQNDYAGAVKYFTQAIAVKPDYRAYFGRAGAYQRLEQREKAIADYSEAIRLKPDSAPAYHDRAVCEVRLDRLDDAIHDYDRALELDPSNPRTWNGRGAIYLKKGGYKKAINYFSKALSSIRSSSRRMCIVPPRKRNCPTTPPPKPT